jgi:hypothetical protein
VVQHKNWHEGFAACYQSHFHEKGDSGKLADHSTEAVTNGCVNLEPCLLLPVSQQICGDLHSDGTECEFQPSFQVSYFHAEFIQSSFPGVILYGIPSRLFTYFLTMFIASYLCSICSWNAIKLPERIIVLLTISWGLQNYAVLLTYLLHGAESFLRSKQVLR